jgi:2-dehydropantoate 2-reductase
LWASYWRKAGVDVTLICPTVRTQSFLELTNDKGNFQFDINTLTVEQLNHQPEKISQLLICTKAQHTIDAVESIQQSIDDNATILVVQNGMAAQQLSSVLPSQQLYFGITTDGAYRTDQLTVVHAGRGVTHIGHRQTGSDNILNKLPINDLNIQLCDDFEQRQWLKLAINCAINGLTVIHQCRNGELLAIPDAVKSMKAICRETSQLDQFCDTPLKDADYLYQQVENALIVTADNFSSMYQDAKQGNSTEIDFLNGYLLKQAEEQNMTFSENERIVNAVKNLTHHDQ